MGTPAKKISEEESFESEEIRKCMNGYRGLMYFIDTYVWIQDRKTKNDMPFKLWPGQSRVIPFFLQINYMVILKARQLGLTWLVACYALWRGVFHSHELIVVISAKEDLSIEFLDRVKFMFDRLPDWMKPRVYKRSTQELSFGYEIKDDQGNVSLHGLNSVIKSLPATPDAGQSKTISLLIMDESALNRYCREIWAAASPTLEHAAGKAIIISNPSKNRPGWPWTRDLYTNAMKGVNSFKQIFLSWREVPGRGDDFLQRKQSEEGLDDEDLSMQYPSTEEEAVSVLGGSYFGRTLQGFESVEGTRGILKRNSEGKLEIEYDHKGIIEVWEPPEKTHSDRYALGSDISEGLGESYSVAYIYDRLLNKYVCRMRSNRVHADLWGMMCSELGEYYNNAMICLERNGAGITAILTIQDKYTNLFYRRKPGKMKGEFVLEYGWLQTNENKQILSDELKRHFRLVFSEVYCVHLIDEASTYIRHENGKLGHEEGKLDDCVIAAGLALQCSLMMNPVVEIKAKKKVNPYAARISELEEGDGEDFERYIEHNYPTQQDL